MCHIKLRPFPIYTDAQNHWLPDIQVSVFVREFSTVFLD